VSDSDNGDWWQASNGQWYPPATHPTNHGEVPGEVSPAALAPQPAMQTSGPSPWPPAPPGYPPTPPFVGQGAGAPSTKQSHKTLWIVLGSVVGALVLIGVIVGATHPGGSTSGSENPSGHLGQTVSDGDFEFRVVTVTCGSTLIGSTVFGTRAPAGSKFCIAGIAVGNKSTSAQLFSASDQKAIDTSGQELSADTGAMLFMTTNKVVATLNPGVAIAVRIPFELPESARISSFELHDSAFSGGVSVENRR
jgi:hypothetical protein